MIEETAELDNKFFAHFSPARLSNFRWAKWQRMESGGEFPAGPGDNGEGERVTKVALLARRFCLKKRQEFRGGRPVKPQLFQHFRVIFKGFGKS
jgi:hypothetical protein